MVYKTLYSKYIPNKQQQKAIFALHVVSIQTLYHPQITHEYYKLKRKLLSGQPELSNKTEDTLIRIFTYFFKCCKPVSIKKDIDIKTYFDSNKEFIKTLCRNKATPQWDYLPLFIDFLLQPDNVDRIDTAIQKQISKMKRVADKIKQANPDEKISFVLENKIDRNQLICNLKDFCIEIISKLSEDIKSNIYNALIKNPSNLFFYESDGISETYRWILYFTLYGIIECGHEDEDISPLSYSRQKLESTYIHQINSKQDILVHIRLSNRSYQRESLNLAQHGLVRQKISLTQKGNLILQAVPSIWRIGKLPIVFETQQIKAKLSESLPFFESRGLPARESMVHTEGNYENLISKLAAMYNAQITFEVDINDTNTRTIAVKGKTATIGKNKKINDFYIFIICPGKFNKKDIPRQSAVLKSATMTLLYWDNNTKTVISQVFENISEPTQTAIKYYFLDKDNPLPPNKNAEYSNVLKFLKNYIVPADMQTLQTALKDIWSEGIISLKDVKHYDMFAQFLYLFTCNEPTRNPSMLIIHNMILEFIVNMDSNESLDKLIKMSPMTCADAVSKSRLVFAMLSQWMPKIDHEYPGDFYQVEPYNPASPVRTRLLFEETTIFPSEDSYTSFFSCILEVLDLWIKNNKIEIRKDYFLTDCYKVLQKFVVECYSLSLEEKTDVVNDKLSGTFKKFSV